MSGVGPDSRGAQVAVFALTLVVLLVAWSVWRGRSQTPSWAPEGSCEQRCYERDSTCSAVAATQGGWPAATLPDPDRKSMCNGLCYVLRRADPASTDPCLAR